MKEIQLTKGLVTRVDDNDYDYLSTNFKWFANPAETGFYARTRLRGGRGKKVYLHRLLLNPPKGMEVDHINGDKLDNRRANLRIVLKGENGRNTPRKRVRNAKTPYKGVKKHHKKWMARCWFEHKEIYIGLFPTIEAAAQAYDTKMRQLFGTRFWPNFH